MALVTPVLWDEQARKHGEQPTQCVANGSSSFCYTIDFAQYASSPWDVLSSYQDILAAWP
eukprot:6176668-Pleurochrysis_carterae.AAC.5